MNELYFLLTHPTKHYTSSALCCKAHYIKLSVSFVPLTSAVMPLNVNFKRAYQFNACLYHRCIGTLSFSCYRTLYTVRIGSKST